MGDRVLIQCHDGEKFGPVIYLHWGGADAPAIVGRLVERMRSNNRMNDIAYWSARMVQESTLDDAGALSVGIMNSEQILTKEDSHGDAGVVLVDARDGSVVTLGGYLKPADFKHKVEAAGSSGIPGRSGL